MPKNIFINFCEQLNHTLSPKLDNLFLSVQTNGVLIDKEWIKIFERFKIRVGISLDGPTDELMSTDPATTTLTNKTISETTLKEVLTLPIFSELSKAFSQTPKDCQNCCWEKCCGGGGITNRFSLETRFNNPSIYCDGLKVFFSDLFQYLIKSGMPYSEIEKRLLH